MDTLNKFLAGAIALSFAVIIFKDGGQGANQILSGFADFNVRTFTALQGRN